MDQARILILLALLGLTSCGENKNETGTLDYLQYCTIDFSKTGYDLASEYDNCAGKYAQYSTAHLESDDIEVQVEYLPPIDFFSAYATLNKQEKRIHSFYTFVPEKMSGYENTPSTINGALIMKLRSKESIDKAFGFDNGKPHGICADVQQTIYNNVLNSVLTREQKSTYLSKGKSLSVLKDDDKPPLSSNTNPLPNGGEWMSRDVANAITNDGDSYFFEPVALYIESDDPNLPTNMPEGLKGVMYCKLLSHQAILTWMLAESFEDNPTFITPLTGDNCEAPISFEGAWGSCVFYFPPASSYYCSDYTGPGFDKATAMKKCASRASSEVLETVYSEKSCDERLAEIASKIPDFAGFQGLCIIHCYEEGEFLWNVYQEDPEPRCSDYPYLTPEEKEALLEEVREGGH